MNILFVGTLCSEKLISKMLDEQLGLPNLATQKFYRLLVQGIALNEELFNIKVLATPDYVKKIDGSKFIFKKKEVENNVNYSYTPIVLFPVVKRLVIIFSILINILKWKFQSKYKHNVLIFDVLNLSSSFTCVVLSKLFNIKTIAVVTDLPSFMFVLKEKISFYNKVIIFCQNFIIKMSSGYILLSEYMNLVINKNIKPYCIIEGLADIQLLNSSKIENDTICKEKIVHYSGGLYEKFGVKSLIEAFMLIKGDNIKLHLFGNGDLVEYINYCIKKDNRIIFFGYRENKEILKDQKKSLILVNPRYSTEEYTKYSFPSKTIEYMSSGVPLLTTKLPGIPSEYFEFVYSIVNETIDGYKTSLEKILNKPKCELISFGAIAKDFVMTHKNNKVQALKIYNLFNDVK
jgi:glycosyltransferase involved in cell wall biosynthesis